MITDTLLDALAPQAALSGRTPHPHRLGPDLQWFTTVVAVVVVVLLAVAWGLRKVLSGAWRARATRLLRVVDVLPWAVAGSSPVRCYDRTSLGLGDKEVSLVAELDPEVALDERRFRRRSRPRRVVPTRRTSSSAPPPRPSARWCGDAGAHGGRAAGDGTGCDPAGRAPREGRRSGPARPRTARRSSSSRSSAHAPRPAGGRCARAQRPRTATRPQAQPAAAAQTPPAAQPTAPPPRPPVRRRAAEQAQAAAVARTRRHAPRADGEFVA